MTAKERARKWLDELPLSKKQRELYLSGWEKMSEEECKPLVDDLEKSLEELPATLEAARKLLESRRNRS